MDASVRVAELPGSRGAGWLGEAFRMFRRNPMVWIGLCSGWISITLALMIVPVIGMVISNFLQPAFFASFAICAYKQLAGERVMMVDLFTGFKRNFRPLVNLGAILLLAQLAILVIMAMLGLPTAGTSQGEFDVNDYVESLKGKEWILATGFLLTMAVKGALWFAPPLIAFHGMSTMQAMRWSLYAAISNLGTMIVYGVLLLGLFLLALIPWALGLVLVIPVTVISTFVGYREVFEPATPP